ncbi:MAG TPA: hypothetical protein VLS93_17895 [Anaeromyxobacteraceae bacterium]|nr:hypothetical protein [Anaeromyxobacteraceae bacterium]
MRPSLLALVAALALPAAALAEDPRVEPRANPSRQLTRPAAAPRAVPAPPRGQGPYTAVPAPRRGTVVGPGGYVIAPVPFWWGWNWGYGYYPLFPRPYYQPYGGMPPPQAPPVSLVVAAAAASSGEGVAAGVSVTMDGRLAGMHASFDGFEPTLSGAGSASSALTRARVAATFSVLSADAFRVRLEAGGSALSIPSEGAYAGAPYAGRTSFGPDVGVSGQLGLVGPVGVEAHARFTLYPVPVTDVRSALALRAGPVAVTAGWRAIQVSGDGTDGPDAWFGGPEMGVQARF